MTLSKNVFVQLAMIAVSLGIIFTFVEPTFTDIGVMQDDIVIYQTEQTKVIEVNAQLNSLVNVLNSISPIDERRLLTYMPDEIDTISVIRDLSLISRLAGVVYLSTDSTGLRTPADERVEDVGVGGFVEPRGFGFNLNVEGTYEQIKYLFTLLEQNNYPIEVQGVTVRKKDGGFLTVGIDLSVYAHEANAQGAAIEF